jgi:hypothetical protein
MYNHPHFVINSFKTVKGQSNINQINMHVMLIRHLSLVSQIKVEKYVFKCTPRQKMKKNR